MSEERRREIVQLVAKSPHTVAATVAEIRASKSSYYRWHARAECAPLTGQFRGVHSRAAVPSCQQKEGDMPGRGERTRRLGNAALGLAVPSLPICVALVLLIGDLSASRIAISLAFAASLASVGAFTIWRGIAQSRPLTIAKGASVLLPMIAFGLLTQDSGWWSPGVLGDCDTATAFAVVLVVVTPAAVSAFLGALAIRDGQEESQSPAVTKGMCALPLGVGLGCLEGAVTFVIATAH